MLAIKKSGLVIGVFAALAISGCTNTNGNYGSSQTTAHSGSVRSGYGSVHSVELVATTNTGIAGTGIGVGAIAGAVVGGIVGNQVGKGRGNTVATVAGAAGGAYVGNEIEKRQNRDAYKVIVRMNDGAYQTIVQDADAGLRVGDRVRIENGSVRRY